MKTALMGLILIIIAFRVRRENFDRENPLSLTKQEIIEMSIATIAISLIHFYL